MVWSVDKRFASSGRSLGYGHNIYKSQYESKVIGAMAKQDPFYVLKMEIEESVSDGPSPRILRPSLDFLFIFFLARSTI